MLDVYRGNYDPVSNNLLKYINAASYLDCKSKLNELLMMEDYNSFQIIKEFEKHKHELLEKNIDLYNYDDSDFHEERINRNYIVHQKILQN